MNRDPARPEGALLGLWRVLRTPWTPSWGPWGPCQTPLGGHFPGFWPKCPFWGGLGAPGWTPLGPPSGPPWDPPLDPPGTPLGPPWDPLGPPWDPPGTPVSRLKWALGDPPGRSFPGVLAEMPVLGGSGGSQGGAQGSQVASPGGPGPLRWGPGYIEGFNMYTGVWRGSKCSGGSLFWPPRLKMASPDCQGGLDRPVRPGLSSRDASTIRRSQERRVG